MKVALISLFLSAIHIGGLVGGILIPHEGLQNIGIGMTWFLLAFGMLLIVSACVVKVSGKKLPYTKPPGMVARARAHFIRLLIVGTIIFLVFHGWFATAIVNTLNLFIGFILKDVLKSIPMKAKDEP